MRRTFTTTSLGSVLALSFAAPGAALANDSPTRTVGPQLDGSIVASDNQLLTPAGKTVQLGSPVRAKAVAINPNAKTHSGAVLLMGAAEPIIIFDTRTGAVLQRYLPTALSGTTSTSSPTGSFTGIAYSPDGSKLLFSQDNSNIQVAVVNPSNGELADDEVIPVPAPNNPNLYTPGTANPGGLALVNDTEGLVALNASNALGVFDIATGAVTSQIPVGNAPNRVVVSGNTAYLSNEGGRPATASDFTTLSDGTPIVADKTTGSAITGTVSAVDLDTGKLVATIDVGLHPAGMTVANGNVYVANAYSDTISVISTATNTVTRTIKVGVPLPHGAFGAGVDDVAVVGDAAYVTMGEANAVAVLDLTKPDGKAVIGYIPTLYFPTTIAYDAADRKLVVSDDKGTGTQGSIGSAEGAEGFNTHQDTGTVSLIPVPTSAQLTADTVKVVNNNNWLSPYADVGPQYVDPSATPVAVPAHIGEPSLIKHVWYIIKENRTYDQMLGDVAWGNGDPSIAVFAANVPNQHQIVQRFPLLDNFYAPSRQSADGHPWTIESGSFYSNDILSPDWIRSYPGGNDNDALTFTRKGYIWTDAVRKGLDVKIYGEWSDGSVVANNPATGAPYTWADFFETSLYNETGGKQGSNIVPPDSDSEKSQIPGVDKLLDPHYPSFNLGIPDQYRMDYYLPILQQQDATDTVPALTVMWLPNDHTNGLAVDTPIPNDYEADNDLALGRLVQAISHTKAWATSAIFVTEDDAQDGVDHVDGHREPAYVISPYAVAPQAADQGREIRTTYTVVNMERTIENILGLRPMSQFDRVASPMFDCFQNTPDDTPYTDVPATTPLNINENGVPVPGTGSSPVYSMRMFHPTPFQKAWELASVKIMTPNMKKADVVDERFLNHVIWYAATDWKRFYPGDHGMVWPGSFRNVVNLSKTDDD